MSLLCVKIRVPTQGVCEKFEETPKSHTANTAVRNLTAVTAVPTQGVCEKTGGENLEKPPGAVLPILPLEGAFSNGSNGSTLPGPNAEVARSRWWRLHTADGGIKEVYSDPPTSAAEVLEGRSGIVSAEHFDPGTRTPTAPPNDTEEQEIRAWLQSIGETDIEVVANVLGRCRRDAEAKEYYLREAARATGVVTINGFDQWLNLVEGYVERVAIAEYDGGLPRREAEAQAWRSVLDRARAGLH